MGARARAQAAMDDLQARQSIRFDVEVFTNIFKGHSVFIGEAGSITEASQRVRDCGIKGITGAALRPINDNPDADDIAATHEWRGDHLGFIDVT